MIQKDFLESKFIEINKLKSMVITYPEEYKNNIIGVIEKVCNEINIYLDEKKKRTYRDVKKEFTLEELAEYNGKNGKPAYVVVNGTVYEVTDISIWKDGVHFGIKAGVDHSESFKNCHNRDINILKKLRIIGTIKQ